VAASARKSVIRNKCTRRRSEDMKKKCTGTNEKNMRENKSARIGDVLSSGIFWNEGLKLPTLNNCPECNDKYTEYR
jgi:hypothetical protein